MESNFFGNNCCIIKSNVCDDNKNIFGNNSRKKKRK